MVNMLKHINSKPLVLDGAMGTQLELKLKYEKKDMNIQTHPLWSALVLLKYPKLIEEVHYDYLCSGANIISTSTYQASKRGLLEHSSDVKNEDDVFQIYRKATECAVNARDRYLRERKEKKDGDENRTIFIMGSIGPFGGYLANGAEYTGKYEPFIVEPSELRDFHYDITKFFLEESDCDIIGFETIPSFLEFQQVVELMEELLLHKTKPFIISLSFKDANRMADGTPISQVIGYLDEKLSKNNNLSSSFLGLGCNCIPLESATDILSTVSSLNTNRFPLIVYPNAGLDYDLSKGEYTVEKTSNEVWRGLCRLWIKEYNVRIVGGCCGSGPEEISVIRETIDMMEAK